MPGTRLATAPEFVVQRPQSHRRLSLASTRCWFRRALDIPRNHPDLTLVLLLMLAAAAPRVFLQLKAPTFIFSDSPGYVEPAVNLVHGDGLATSLKRTLGYPLLVGAGLFAGGQLDIVTAAQHSLGILTVALTYFLGRACANRPVGVAAGATVAFSGTQLTYEHALLPAAPFTFLVVGLCLLLIWLLRYHGLLPAALAGLVIALLALLRPVGLLLLPFVVIATAFGRGSPRGRLGRILVASLLLAIVVTPGLLVNLSAHGSFSDSGAPGKGLLAHTLLYGRGRFTFEDPGIPANSDPTEQTARSILQAAVQSDTTPSQARDQIRTKLKLTESETDDLLQRIATEAIYRQPLDLLLGIPDALGLKLYAPDERMPVLWSSLTPWEKLPTLDSLARRPTLDQESSRGQVEALLNLLRLNRFGFMLPLLGLLAPALVRRSHPRWPVLLLTALYACLVLVQVVPDSQIAHYRYGVEPLLAVLVVLTLWHVLVWIAQRLSATAFRAAQLGRVDLLKYWGAFGLALALGVFLRCWTLDRFDPFAFGTEFDEGIRMAQLDLMNAGFRPFSQIYASQGPLLLDYFYPFYTTFGRDILAARLAVTAASLGCLIAVFLVGRSLRDPLAGLAALVLLAVSPATIQYSRLALAELPSLGPACLALWLAVLAKQHRPLLLYLSAALFACGLLLKPMVITAAVPILLTLAPSWRRPLSQQSLGWVLTVVAVVGLVVLAIGPDLLWEPFVAYRQGATGLGAVGMEAWSLETNWQLIVQVLTDDAPLAIVALTALPVLLRSSPRYAVIAGGWLVTTFVMLMVYSPLNPKHVAYLVPALALLGGGGLSCAVGLTQAPRSVWRTSLLAPIGIASAFAILSIAGTARADSRLAFPDETIPDADSDLQDILTLTDRLTDPADYVVTDYPLLAHLAHRLIPPALVDPSLTRIVAGSLTDQGAIEETQARQAGAVIYWASRLRTLKQYSAWIETAYTLVRLYDNNRALYVRNDLLAGLPGYPGGVPSRELVRFGDAMILVGSELAPQSASEQRLSLTFQALRPIAPQTYVVHLQLRNRQGKIELDRDDPLLPAARVELWSLNQPLVHRRSLNLTRVNPGMYRLLLYVSERRNGPELPVVISGQDGPQVGPSPFLVDLGTVSVR